MRIERLSDEAQEGLRLWAAWQLADALFFETDDVQPWAWAMFQLRAAEDRPEWFPKGKSATIQVIELWLHEEAAAEANPMPDEALLQERIVRRCVALIGGDAPLSHLGFEVTLSCGHQAVFAIEPHMDYSVPCAQCVNLFVDRRKSAGHT